MAMTLRRRIITTTAIAVVVGLVLAAVGAWMLSARTLVGELGLSRHDPEVRAALLRLARRLGIILILGTVTAVLLARSLAEPLLRPLTRLTAAARHIAQTRDPGILIPVERDDEIAQLTIAFNQMTTALAEARAQQSRLIADARHELRTPLTSLRTNLDHLRRSGSAMSSAEHQAVLGALHRQIDELTSLVIGLTTLDEALTEERETVSLDDLVRSAVERVSLRGGNIHMDLESTTIVGEPSALERAVVNILDNAVKFSPPDGPIRVVLRDRRLTVTDCGPGIASADLPHIFERFYRSSTARGLPGSGLGLAIVSETISRHGGTITVDQPTQGGTRVVVAFDAG